MTEIGKHTYYKVEFSEILPLDNEQSDLIFDDVLDSMKRRIPSGSYENEDHGISLFYSRFDLWYEGINIVGDFDGRLITSDGDLEFRFILRTPFDFKIN